MPEPCGLIFHRPSYTIRDELRNLPKIVIGTAATVAGAGFLLYRSTKKKPALSPYRGSHTSKTLHRAGCRFYDSAKLTRVFRDLPDALEAGYRPCRICIP